MKKIILLCLFSSLYFAQDLKFINLSQNFNNTEFEYATNRIVVKFNDDIMSRLDKKLFSRGRVGVEEIDYLVQELNVELILQQFPNAKQRLYNGNQIKLANWHKLYFEREINVDFVVNEFKKIGSLLDVQPVGIHPIIRTSNDPSRSDQWHLDQPSDNDIDIENAWDIETGNDDIIVAILDSGVRYFHKDLGGSAASFNSPTSIGGNIWINTADNDDDGVDDDGNGYIDDWVGYDFVSNEPLAPAQEDGDTPDNDPRDFNGHGTHCAGIVGAINNNGYAVSSPAGGWNNGSQTASGNGVKIMALRIGYTGGPPQLGLGFVGMDYAAEAFYYAADNGANIASCSWGSSNSGGLGDALDYFLATGSLVFKAAGNDNDEASDYMLDRPDVVGVASTDQNDVKSDFSTYGTFVDISAPGTAIMSTYHVWDDPENDYVASLSGTSMATPLAAGLAALIWSRYPSWTAAQVEQQLYDTADDIYGIPGNSSYSNPNKLGTGRINAHQALAHAGIADLKLFLQGSYNQSSGLMNTIINSDVPLTSPYSEDPVTVSSIPPDVVDWVLIELRTSTTGTATVSKSAFLRNDGRVLDIDGLDKVNFGVTAGDYFIVVRHRNHLPIMSANLISLPNSSTYDFTLGSGQYYGTGGAIQLD